MTTLFAITLFWSAALLFWVEPMVGKLVLPQLGGAPAVWNTCMVFFQAMLLAGYSAAHWLTGRLQPRAQLATHLALLLVALATLPITLNENAAAPWQHWPTAWLLLQLLVNVGPAFFVLALTTPLLQRWFASSAHASARDPYFLYAASNLGSFVALLGYPIFIELNWPLREQSWLWAAAFLLMPLLVLACGAKSAPSSLSPIGGEGQGEGVGWGTSGGSEYDSRQRRTRGPEPLPRLARSSPSPQPSPSMGEREERRAVSGHHRRIRPSQRFPNLCPSRIFE